ncbi:MAG: hypothetical protein GYB68_02960 [Chloroflexi bacterium]|nr:hypothetical protein [Chloroflexota bacterium]
MIRYDNWPGLRIVLYWLAMEKRTDWQSLGARWQSRLDEAGLGAVVGAIGQALQPLSPLAVQMLWFSQPAFALFDRGDDIMALADLLEERHAPTRKDDRP